MEFLAGHTAETMRISVITFGELDEGYEDPASSALDELIAPYGIIDISQSVARGYAAISRSIRSSGDRWGDNDLWIGATGLKPTNRSLSRSGSFQPDFRTDRARILSGPLKVSRPPDEVPPAARA